MLTDSGPITDPSCAKANGLCLVWAPTSSERSDSDPDKTSSFLRERGDSASDGKTCQSHVTVGDPEVKRSMFLLPSGFRQAGVS